MNRKSRLELTWIGKDQQFQIEPRILLENTDKSYHAGRHVTEGELFDNRLIFGDNLLVLKALESEFEGQIKRVYIDPPFNTGAALEHYDDGLEHSLWLQLMYQRLSLLWRLLRNDGVLFVHLDDTESAYCKILLR